jgi:hypothetical protein
MPVKYAALLVLTLASCSSPQASNGVSAPARPPRTRYAVVPAAEAPEHLGRAQLAHAWRIDTVTGELSFCTYVGASGTTALKPAAAESVTCPAAAKVE